MGNSNSTFINRKGKRVYRQPVSCFSRVMGYLSPVTVPKEGIIGGLEVNEGDENKSVFNHRYNVGKKSEFYSRKYYSKLKASNHDFNKQYSK